MSWLVYRLTNSAFLLGAVGFASQLPIFLLTPFAGVLADRMDRHRLLIVAQILAMVQAFILALLVLTGVVEIWQIIILGVFLGLVDALDMPVRQSFMVHVVEKQDLGNAIALNASIVNSARLLGPSLAGILIASVGEGICFLLNGFSYLAVLLSLLAMKPIAREIEKSKTHVFQRLKEGFRYVSGFPPIRSILLLLALVSLMGMPYHVMMPIFAKDILHGGPRTLGFLMGSAGVGALAGAIYLASRKSIVGLEGWIVLTAGIFGMGLVAFSFSRTLWVSLVLLLFVGFGMIVQMASSNTVLQTVADEDKRGRVMSFYTMAFRGTVPFGSLLAGGLASMVGAPNTLLVGGIFCMLGAFLFLRQLPALRKTVWPVYIKLGILQDDSEAVRPQGGARSGQGKE